jgi:hypothetical protein
MLLQTVERRGAELDTVLEAIDCCLRAKEVKQLLVQKAAGKNSKVTIVVLLVVSNYCSIHTLKRIVNGSRKCLQGTSSLLCVASTARCSWCAC